MWLTINNEGGGGNCAWLLGWRTRRVFKASSYACARQEEKDMWQRLKCDFDVERHRQREDKVVSGNVCIPWAPIRVMQDRGAHICVCLWEIRWKRGHRLLSEIFTIQPEYPDQKTDDGMGPGKSIILVWGLLTWQNEKVSPCLFPMSESSRAWIHHHLSRGDNKKPHVPFPNPADHYHNSVLISTASATQQQRSKNDPKLWLCLLLLPEREMWRFGDGVGAEISQGLWSHSCYKKGTLWCGEGVVL